MKRLRELHSYYINANIVIPEGIWTIAPVKFLVSECILPHQGLFVLTLKASLFFCGKVGLGHRSALALTAVRAKPDVKIDC